MTSGTRQSVISQKGECSNIETQYKNCNKVNNKFIYTSECTEIAEPFYYIGGGKESTTVLKIWDTQATRVAWSDPAMISQEGLHKCCSAWRWTTFSLLQLLGLQLLERYKAKSRMNGSFDNAEIVDLGSMMDSQDKPKKVSQICKSKKTTLLGLHIYAAGNADLKLDLMIWWL